MKVLIVAFGHPDNVLSLGYHLSKRVDLSILFVMSGKYFRRGIFDLDIRNQSYSLIKDKTIVFNIIPNIISDFIKNRFQIWLHRIPSSKIFRFDNIYYITKLAVIIMKSDFDIIHYNGSSGFIFPIYLLNKKKKQFWTLHDYKSHIGEGRRKIQYINRFLANLKKLYVVQHYEHLSRTIIKEFGLNKNKVYTLKSGSFDIFKAFNEKKIFDTPKYILFFGRISEYKGLNLLLEAYSKLDNPTNKLVIAGSGNIELNYKEYFANPNIILLNRYIKVEELIYLIKNSLFVVVPYIESTHSAVIATSLTYNKPILASDLIGFREVIRNEVTGKLFRSGDSEDLYHKLKLFLENPKKLEDIEKNISSEKIFGKLSWNSIIQDYCDMYNSVG